MVPLFGVINTDDQHQMKAISDPEILSSRRIPPEAISTLFKVMMKSVNTTDCIRFQRFPDNPHAIDDCIRNITETVTERDNGILR